ncbi:MAG: spermidine/putrescine ABC transporter substrate-binding protein [Anaerolineae bacterium]|nr:spermidine/putrescine ABC transporter substrate-binding protein [Anaerolineae bacterium]MDW8299303.1 spermidine/putrescine ABC transporter substrate-binding protein [Anaerolineae bacterium]
MAKRLAILALVAIWSTIFAVTNAPLRAQQLDSVLYVYNWGDYIDEELLIEYEQQFGVRVVYDNYATNEEMFAKLQAGAEYDIVFPSDYMVARMIALGLLAKIDQENVPNRKFLDKQALDTWYDPENFCVPYMWGTSGIAYHVSLEEPPDSWAALFDPEQVAKYTALGGINVMDDQRELLGAVLKYLGYSANSTERAELEQARDTLLSVASQYRYFNSADYQETLLPAREVIISHAWNGNTAKAALLTRSETYPNGEWRYIIPKEGGLRFQESICVTARSPRKATAEHFINFLLKPENAARISNATGYLSPNIGARDLIDPLLKQFLPTEEELARLEWIRPLDSAGRRLWDEIWAEIRIGS